jgi:hypothetical protein
VGHFGSGAHQPAGNFKFIGAKAEIERRNIRFNTDKIGEAQGQCSLSDTRTSGKQHQFGAAQATGEVIDSLKACWDSGQVAVSSLVTIALS